MIDWIVATFPLQWTHPVASSYAVRTDRWGVEQRKVPLRYQVRGSWDASFTLVTKEARRIEVSGNPSKFLQGHNAFGSSDIRGLVVAAVRRAIELYNADPETEPHMRLCPTEKELQAWDDGRWTISHVDVNESILVLPTDRQGNALRRATPSDVNALLREMDNTTIKWRGRGVAFEGTRYWGIKGAGQRQSPWILKAYNKWEELQVASHAPAEDLPMREQILDWCSDKVRFEVTVRTQELKRLIPGPDGEWLPNECVDHNPLDLDRELETVPSLRYAYAWNEETALRVFQKYFAKIELTDRSVVDTVALEDLSGKCVLAFNAWKNGQDVRTMTKISRATLYRYRREIMDAVDCDIFVPCPSADTLNVVSLKRYLSAAPAPSPAWAPRELLWRAA